MNTSEAIRFLQNRPAVHQLCFGTWLQAPFRLSLDVMAVPLADLGYERESVYAAQYVAEVLAAPVGSGAIQTLAQSAAQARPVVVLCAPVSVEAAPEALEELARERLERARQVLAWVSGDEVTPFAWVIAAKTDTKFRMIPPLSRRRQRLFGIGGTKEDFQENLSRLMNVALEDEHFAFALSLHHDAVKESDPRFRIGRLFNVLECLAARLKCAERPSRKAVKYLIGLEEGAASTVNIGGQEYRYDAVEIGGRIRDKLFHGVPFRRDDLSKETQSAFDLYEAHPEIMAEDLAMHCELELAKWANGTSRGRAV